MPQKNEHSVYLLESVFKWIRIQMIENKVPLLASFIAGLAAHMFAFTNKLVSWDEVGSLFNKGTTSSSGRWGLDLMQYLFPNYSIPWIYGLISISLMAVSVCVIVHIFHIRRKLFQILLAGCILTFPSLTATISFMYTLSSYAVAFLLAVVAVWFLQAHPGKGFLPALGCMILSLGIYQSYISIAASFLLLIVLQRLFENEDVLSTVRRGLIYVGFLIAALGLYYLTTLVIHRFSGVDFNNYTDVRIKFSLGFLPHGIVEAYRSFVHFFTTGYWGLIPTRFSQLIHGVCILAAGALFLFWVLGQKHIQPGRLALILVLLAIFPLAVNCMYLFVSNDPSLTAIHTLVLYGFVAVYILAIIMAESCTPPEDFLSTLSRYGRHIALNLISVGLLLVSMINTYIANEAYLNMYLRYENTYAFYASLVADLKMMPEFNEDTRFALIGTYEEPYFFYDEFPFTYQIRGSDGIRPDSYTYSYFLYYYLGHWIWTASDEEISEITATQEFQEMAVYPYYGSMKMFGDILVVKLS